MELVAPLLEKGGPWVVAAVLLWLLIRSEQRIDKIEGRLDNVQDARIGLAKEAITAIERNTTALDLLREKVQ
jgi:hypothetical protein